MVWLKLNGIDIFSQYNSEYKMIIDCWLLLNFVNIIIYFQNHTISNIPRLFDDPDEEIHSWWWLGAYEIRLDKAEEWTLV